eukprot:PhM_4_TR7533/c0_g1_i2/m.28160
MPHPHPHANSTANSTSIIAGGASHALHDGRGSRAHHMFAFVGVVLVVGAVAKNALAGSKVPYTVFMFLFGCVLGALTFVWDGIEDYVPVDELPPEFIFYIFLPILIFQGAFDWEARVFKEVVGHVLILAFPGLVLATAMTGAVCKLMYGSWSWPTALLFGSLISATDPVATVALLRELGADKSVTGVIDGEALLNDGSAIVLFALLLPSVASGSFDSSFGDVVVSSLQLVLGALLLGLVVGSLMVFALERTYNDVVVEITITYGASAVAFYLADHAFGFSGVITIVVTGLCFSFRRYAVSPESSHALNEAWEIMVYVANTVIFTMVGLLIAREGIEGVSWYDVGMLFILYVALMFIRFVMVACAWPIMRMSLPITWEGVVLISYSGLRGAVALTLALAIKQNTHINEHIRHLFLFLTAGIVVLTTLINGCTCLPLVRYLGLNRKPAAKRAMMTQAVNSVASSMMLAITEMQTDSLLHSSSWGAVRKRTVHRLEDPYKLPEDNDANHSSNIPSESTASSQDLARFVWLRSMKGTVHRLHETGMLSQGSFYALHTLLCERIEEAKLISFRDIQIIVHPLAFIFSASASDQNRRLRDLCTRIALLLVPGLKQTHEMQELEVFLAYRAALQRVLEVLRQQKKMVLAQEVGEASEHQQQHAELLEHTRNELNCIETMLSQRMDLRPKIDFALKTRIASRTILNSGQSEINAMVKACALAHEEAAILQSDLDDVILTSLKAPRVTGTGKHDVLFRELRLLRCLPRAERERLYAATTQRVFDFGEALAPNQNEDTIFIVAHGLVRVTWHGDGANTPHPLVGEGTYLPMSTAFSFAAASSIVEVFSIPTSIWESLISGNPHGMFATRTRSVLDVFVSFPAMWRARRLNGGGDAEEGECVVDSLVGELNKEPDSEAQDDSDALATLLLNHARYHGTTRTCERDGPYVTQPGRAVYICLGTSPPRVLVHQQGGGAVHDFREGDRVLVVPTLSSVLGATSLDDSGSDPSTTGGEYLCHFEDASSDMSDVVSTTTATEHHHALGSLATPLEGRGGVVYFGITPYATKRRHRLMMESGGSALEMADVLF